MGREARATTPKGLLTVKGGTIKLDRKRRGRLQLSCALAPCAGSLLLKVKGKTVATLAYSLGPGKSAKVRFRLNARGRSLMRRKRTLSATANGRTLKLKRR